MFVKATLRAVFKLLLLKLGLSKLLNVPAPIRILFCESFRKSILTEDQLKTKWDKFLRKYVACARSLSTCAKPFFTRIVSASRFTRVESALIRFRLYIWHFVVNTLSSLLTIKGPEIVSGFDEFIHRKKTEN